MKKCLLLLMLALLISGCGEEPDTPEKALADIKQAIEQCDYDKFAARVDLKTLLEKAYDDSTMELSLRASEFRRRYPDDPFFQNDPDFIMTYIDLNRAEHMQFINAVVDKCFDLKAVPPPKFEDDVVGGTAAELRHYYATTDSTVRNVMSNETKAIVQLNVTFESLYAEGSYTLPLELEFEKSQELWRLTAIKNVDEIIKTLVDIAEKLWPDQLNSR